MSTLANRNSLRFKGFNVGEANMIDAILYVGEAINRLADAVEKMPSEGSIEETPAKGFLAKAFEETGAEILASTQFHIAELINKEGQK